MYSEYFPQSVETTNGDKPEGESTFGDGETDTNKPESTDTSAKGEPETPKLLGDLAKESTTEKGGDGEDVQTQAKP